MEQITTIVFKIKRLDINQAYFTGKVEYNKNEYNINIQGNWKDKLIKLPIEIESKERVLVRLSGPNEVMIEEYLLYKGRSEWVEIDSDEMLHYVADHQDQFDTLEIIT